MSILDIEEIGHVEINVVLKAAQRHEILMVFMEASWSLTEATTACLFGVRKQCSVSKNCNVFMIVFLPIALWLKNTNPRAG